MAQSSPTKAPPEMCMNCGAGLDGLFCSACGQSHKYPRLNLRLWIADAFAGLVSLEAPLIRTAIDLTTKPGRMVRRYIDGQRVRFVGPVTYAVHTSALWIATYAAFPLLPPADASQGTVEAIQRWFVAYGQVLNLGALPAIAAAVWLTFSGSRRTFAEQLALVTYLIGHMFLFRSVLLCIRPLVDLNIPALQITDLVLFLIWFAWGIWGSHRRLVPYIWIRVLLAIIALWVISQVVSQLAISIALGMI